MTFCDVLVNKNKSILNRKPWKSRAKFKGHISTTQPFSRVLLGTEQKSIALPAGSMTLLFK